MHCENLGILSNTPTSILFLTFKYRKVGLYMKKKKKKKLDIDFFAFLLKRKFFNGYLIWCEFKVKENTAIGKEECLYVCRKAEIRDG